MSVAVQSPPKWHAIFVGRVCMVVWWSYIPSLSHEFFSKQYTFVCIQHMSPCSSPTAFTPQGPDLGGSTHGEPPLAIPLMIFMTTQQPSNWGSKWRLDWFSHETSTKLGLNGGTSHTYNQLHGFLKTRVRNACLEPSEWSMNLIKPNPPPFCEPPSLHLVQCGGCTIFLEFVPKTWPYAPFTALSVLTRSPTLDQVRNGALTLLPGSLEAGGWALILL